MSAGRWPGSRRRLDGGLAQTGVDRLTLAPVRANRRSKLSPFSVSPVVSAVVILACVLGAGYRATHRPLPAARTLSALTTGSGVPLASNSPPRDARAFAALKQGKHDADGLVESLIGAGRDPSAVLVATAAARGITSAVPGGPLTTDGGAIIGGTAPQVSAWSSPGRAGFAALMAGRSDRVELVPAIEAMVAAPPSAADAAAGRYALSRLRR